MAQAVNTLVAVAPSAYIYNARLLQTQAAIATGPVMPRNRIRSDLRRPEIQNFLGGMPPDPLASALRVRISSVLLSQFSRRTSANELPSPLVSRVQLISIDFTLSAESVIDKACSECYMDYTVL